MILSSLMLAGLLVGWCGGGRPGQRVEPVPKLHPACHPLLNRDQCRLRAGPVRGELGGAHGAEPASLFHAMMGKARGFLPLSVGRAPGSALPFSPLTPPDAGAALISPPVPSDRAHDGPAWLG